jgi:hypothetical protein
MKGNHPEDSSSSEDFLTNGSVGECGLMTKLVLVYKGTIIGKESKRPEFEMFEFILGFLPAQGINITVLCLKRK